MNEGTSKTPGDDSAYADLVKLMGLTAEETSTLALLRNEALAAAPGMTDDFFARLLAHEGTRSFLPPDHMENLRAGVSQWFAQLFSGLYGTDYIRRRFHLGRVHLRAGVPVRYLLAMLDLVLEHAVRVALHSDRPAVATRAIRKIVALDLALFLQAYENR